MSDDDCWLGVAWRRFFFFFFFFVVPVCAVCVGLPEPGGLPEPLGLPERLGLPEPLGLPEQLGLPEPPAAAAAVATWSVVAHSARGRIMRGWKGLSRLTCTMDG